MNSSIIMLHISFACYICATYKKGS